MPRSLRTILKYFSITVVCLVVLVAIAVGLLPSILKWAIPHWLQQSQLSAHIEDIEIQLFEGRLSVENFTIHKGTQQKLKLGSLIIQLDPREIFDRHIVLQQFSLNGLDLQLEQGPHGAFKLAGFTLPSEQPAKTNTASGLSRPWHVTLSNIALSDLQTCYATSEIPKLCASLQKLGWQGQFAFRFSQSDEDVSKTLQGKLSLELRNFYVKDRQNTHTLVGFTQLLLNKIDIQGLDQLHIDSISLDDPAVLQRPSDIAAKESYTVKGKLLHAENISLKARQQLSIKTVSAHGLQLMLQREPNGQLLITSLLQPYRLAHDDPVDSKQQHVSQGIDFNIGKFNLQDQSSFHFVDKAVKPAAQVELNEIEIELSQIDSTSADNRSPVNIKAEVGQHARMQLQGNIAVFAKRSTLKLQGDIKGLNVADFNSYTQQAIQHYVKSGHLDAATSINIEQGQLDSNTQLLLRQFYLEPSPAQKGSEYREEVGLPLGTALSLLRDRDNSIQLKLPISGDINNPDFSLNDVVRKVSAKAVRAAVINYYSPLGMLSLAGTLFDLATALRFEPVEFEPGKALLDNNDKQQLDKLVNMLAERPHVHLVICGISTQADQFAWFGEGSGTEPDSDDTDTSATASRLSEPQLARLDALARQRSNVVKAYLVEEKQLNPQRLIVCTPKHQQTDGQAPRTELQL